MATENLYSKRLKAQGEVPDVYAYDVLPERLRVQIIYIWRDLLSDRPRAYDRVFSQCRETLQRELGVFELPATLHYESAKEAVVTYFLFEKRVEAVLDVVELLSRELAAAADVERVRKSIEELNARFKEHGVGYQFVDGQIIRIDSELLHTEVVKPALMLLHAPHYAGAQEEFLKAHEHYRAGNAKEALNECLKALESVMKSICDKRGWAFDKSRATASVLIKVCVDNGLIPPFWDAHYNALKSLLENGVPTGRNKLGGHGQGTTPTEVPPHIVAYMLHMTASAIVFLAEAEKALV